MNASLHHLCPPPNPLPVNGDINRIVSFVMTSLADLILFNIRDFTLIVLDDCFSLFSLFPSYERARSSYMWSIPHNEVRKNQV